MSEFVNAGNNHRFRLSSSMSENDTDLPFDILTFEGTAPEDYPFLLTINSGKSNMEIVKVIGPGSDLFTYEVERGQEGTTAQAHEAGSLVENNFTAGTYQALVDSLEKAVFVEETITGDDYILKKYSDGTFELKGHVKRTESLTNKINNMYRTGNLRNELTPIIDDSYKLIYSNAWIMDGHTNSFLVMSSVSNPLNEKSIRYRIMGNNTSPVEDKDFIIGYEAYGTWS